MILQGVVLFRGVQVDKRVPRTRSTPVGTLNLIHHGQALSSAAIQNRNSQFYNFAGCVKFSWRKSGLKLRF